MAGKWKAEAARQKQGKLTTEGAIARIAFWRRETGSEEFGWHALVLKVLRTAPTRKKVTPWWAANNSIALAAFGRLNNPKVSSDVQSEVYDYIDASAKLLEERRPNANVPRYRFAELIDAAFKLASDAYFKAKRRKKKPAKYPGMALLLLAVVVLSSK